MLNLSSGGRDKSLILGVKLPDINWNNHIYQPYAYFGHLDWCSMLLQTAYFPTAVDFDYFVGNLSTPSSRSSSARGLEPYSHQYYYPTDIQKYSGGIGAGLDVLTSLDASAPQHENQVFHTSIDGEVTWDFEPLFHYNSGLTTNVGGDFTMPCVDETYASYYHRRYFATVHPGGPGNVSGPMFYAAEIPGVLGLPFGAALKRLQELSSSDAGQISYVEDYNPYAWDAPLSIPSVHKVRGFTDLATYLYCVGDLEINASGLSFTHYAATNYWLRVCKVNMHFSVVPTGITPAYNSVGNFTHKCVVRCEVNSRWYQRVAASTGGEHPGWIEMSISNFTDRFTLETVDTFWNNPPISQVAIVRDYIPDLMRSNQSLALNGIQRLFADSLGLFRPSCMFSFADAVSNYRAVQGDYLEVLYQYEKLAKLLPDVLTLGDLLVAFSEGNPIRSTKDLIKFFAGLKLQFTFGFSKFVGNVDEISTSAAGIESALRRLDSPATFHGKFHFSVGRILGVDDVVLETRTKIRIGGASFDYVLKLLKLDALGLSPRTANLWALDPFSWLIDQLVGMGSRYDVLDSVIVGLMLNSQYCVHSYRLSFPLPLAVLETNHLRALSPIDVVCYAREVSRVIPTLFSSEIDFGKPRFPPDKGTVSALLLQMLG